MGREVPIISVSFSLISCTNLTVVFVTGVRCRQVTFVPFNLAIRTKYEHTVSGVKFLIKGEISLSLRLWLNEIELILLKWDILFSIITLGMSSTSKKLFYSVRSYDSFVISIFFHCCLDILKFGSCLLCGISLTLTCYNLGYVSKNFRSTFVVEIKLPRKSVNLFFAGYYFI